MTLTAGSIPVVPLPPGLSWTYVVTPAGSVGMAATPRGVCQVLLDAPARWVREFYPDTPAAHVFPHAFPGGKRLVAYLGGLAENLTDLPIDVGGTPFQQTVWRAARQIPFGRVMTYGELARAIGKPGASRAVGQALGANPVPLLVPCHRVVAAGGGLGGFSGGLGWKRKLLELEGSI